MEWCGDLNEEDVEEHHHGEADHHGEGGQALVTVSVALGDDFTGKNKRPVFHAGRLNARSYIQERIDRIFTP